ncbi:MAG: THUMP domain-containing protein [Acidilobaceae archaeon]
MLGRVKDPIEAVNIIKSNITPKTTILRIIPVNEVRSVKLADVKSSILNLLSKIGEGSFAIRLEGHLLDDNGKIMRRIDSIVKLADEIDRSVNLKNPDILVYVKIVKFRGRWVSAIYVGSPNNIVSTVKMFQ